MRSATWPDSSSPQRKRVASRRLTDAAAEKRSGASVTETILHRARATSSQLSCPEMAREEGERLLVVGRSRRVSAVARHENLLLRLDRVVRREDGRRRADRVN